MLGHRRWELIRSAVLKASFQDAFSEGPVFLLLSSPLSHQRSECPSSIPPVSSATHERTRYLSITCMPISNAKVCDAGLYRETKRRERPSTTALRKPYPVTTNSSWSSRNTPCRAPGSPKRGRPRLNRSPNRNGVWSFLFYYMTPLCRPKN